MASKRKTQNSRTTRSSVMRLAGLLSATTLLTGVSLAQAASPTPLDAPLKLAQARPTVDCTQTPDNMDCINKRRPGAKTQEERRPGSQRQDERRPGETNTRDRRPGNERNDRDDRSEAPRPADEQPVKQAVEPKAPPQEKPKAEAAEHADVKPEQNPGKKPLPETSEAAEAAPANDNDRKAPAPVKPKIANDNDRRDPEGTNAPRQQAQADQRDQRRPKPEGDGTLEFSLPLPNVDARVVIGSGANARVEHEDDRRFETRDSRRTIENMDNGNRRITITRPNGARVITIRDRDGNILRRLRQRPNGDKVVLIDNTQSERTDRRHDHVDLPPLHNDMPRDRYIVDGARANRDAYARALAAAPVEQVQRAYSLNEVRDNQRLRAILPRVDLAVNFTTGSAAIPRSQYDTLAQLGETIAARVQQHPEDVFLIEGHTDAVGNANYNLRLSDARAESVALALTDYFDVPPENLVIQGYGEQYLKVQSQGSSAENRRVSVRRITPLLRGGQ